MSGPGGFGDDPFIDGTGTPNSGRRETRTMTQTARTPAHSRHPVAAWLGRLTRASAARPAAEPQRQATRITANDGEAGGWLDSSLALQSGLAVIELFD